MRAPLIAIVLSSIGRAACAQPGNEGPTGLESCFQSARAADAICSSPENDAVQRLDCLQKARTAQLQCLEQVAPKSSAGSPPSEKSVGAGASEMTSGTASPALRSGAAAPESPTATAPRDEPTAAVSPDKPSATVLPDKPIATISPDEATGAISPEKPSAAVSSDNPSATVSPDKPATAVTPDVPAGTVSADKPTVAVSPDLPAPDAVSPSKLRDTNWVVSETTSPVDYSPLITAAIRLPSGVRHAPNTLAIGCRGGRTELLVRTAGTWRASRPGEVQVDYQINDQPLVRLPWTATVDGKTAIYKDDAVGLLQSLPEGARLKINVLDGPGVSHQATFQLDGLDAVRGRIATACKWAPASDKISSQRR
jgi:hypothetical protein